MDRGANHYIRIRDYSARHPSRQDHPRYHGMEMDLENQPAPKKGSKPRTAMLVDSLIGKNEDQMKRELLVVASTVSGRIVVYGQGPSSHEPYDRLVSWTTPGNRPLVGWPNGGELFHPRGDPNDNNT